MDPDLETHYRQTNYWVDDAPNSPFAIRIGETSVDLSVLLMEHGEFEWAYVTACNPYSTWVGDHVNARLMAQLEGVVELSGWTVFHGRAESTTSNWPPEPSLLILGITEAEASELGRRFCQNAILVGGVDGVAHLCPLEAY